MKLKKKTKKKYVCYSSKLGKFHLKRYILSLKGKKQVSVIYHLKDEMPKIWYHEDF